MNKVMVIGCPGSGKSTFSRKLRDKTNLPLFYLDQIWHKPDKTTISKEEFDYKLQELLDNNDKWIIDGSYLRTMEIRLKQADTVFLLDIPVEDCLAGAKKRVGTKREDLPWFEESLDEEFKQWIMDYPKQHLPLIYDLLEKYKDKDIHIFKSRCEADEYIERL